MATKRKKVVPMRPPVGHAVVDRYGDAHFWCLSYVTVDTERCCRPRCRKSEGDRICEVRLVEVRKRNGGKRGR